MDKSTSKITRKFVIKFIIWFLLFTIVSTIGVVMIFAASLDNVDEEVNELASALNSLIIGLAVADLLVAFLATKLAIRGATKKIDVTEDNKKTVIKNISIVLIIFAILVCALHMGIKDSIIELASEDSNVDIEELTEDLDEYVEEHNLSDDEEEEVEAFLDFMKMTNLYAFDGLFMLVMIPVAKKSIEKKVA